MDDHFVDETAQERLLLGPVEDAGLPDRGQPLTQVKQSRPQSRVEWNGLLVLLELLKPRLLLGGFERAQRLFPALLQFGSHQAIIWVYPAELPLHQAGVIAQPLQLLGVGLLTSLHSRIVLAQDTVI
jgi:hypothetical protein